MHAAIETRYLGASNTRGSRVVATYGKTAKRVISYNHALSPSENHASAADALRRAVFQPEHWKKPLLTAETDKGYVHLFALRNA
jgi:hypothetical protein